MVKHAALGLLLLLSPAGSVGASAETWFEAYHKAEGALEQGRFSDAIRHLNDALAEKPDSSARERTYGMRFVSYFPFLKLGIAYYELGQTDAALEAFETEERRGAVASSRDDLAALERYRSLARARKQAEEYERQRRVEQVARESLDRASELERSGRFDDALSALNQALAVAPDLAEARAARARLMKKLADEQARRKVEERHAALVAAGKGALAARDYRRAAASLGEAIALKEDDEALALLAEAQDAIRKALEARENESERRRLVAESLRRAGELERAGDFSGALAELQSVFALEPGNVDARTRQRRIIDRRGADEKSEMVRGLLADAERTLQSNDLERALRQANQVLAIDPDNDEALQTITRAYARLNASLLATDDAPPVIVLDEGEPVVRSPDFVLTGTVYDNTAVVLVAWVDGIEIAPSSLQSRPFLGGIITDFRFRHRVGRGSSELEVVAIDEAGTSSVESYSVEYVAPFYRSAWFGVSAAVFLGLVGLGTLGLRARRRHELLLQRFNPYVVGAPILEQKRFFGRKSLLEYVLRRIHNNSILIYGERRIGKTSFQHQLKKALLTLEDADFEFFPVYVDLQGTPEEKFFATLSDQIFDELSARLGGIRPTAADAYGYKELVSDLHRVLKVLKESTPKRVKLALLIDEVDELNEYDPRVNQKLRSLFMRTFAESLVSVVSGVAIKKHWEREGSPWYNFFQEIEVKPFNRDEAIALIEAPVQGVFRFGDGVVEEILRRTDCKPYLIQRVCSALVDRMHDERRREFTLNDVESVCQPQGL
jgi:tetratricopeptide (TPR) repeat protein